MPIFEDRPRTDLGGAGYSEPAFAYLDRSGRAPAATIRSALDAWFDRFPPDGRHDLLARLRRKEIPSHLGALLELWTSETLQQLGFVLTTHPEMPSVPTKPDFEATRNGERLLVECTTAMESAGAAGSTHRANEAFDALGALTSAEFALDVNVLSAGPRPLPPRRFSASVQRWMGGLDRGYLRSLTSLYDQVPHTWQEDSWLIETYAFTLKDGVSAGPVLGMSSRGAALIEAHDRLRRSVELKGRHYGADPGSPVLLVIVPGFDRVTDVSIWDALIGDREWNVSFTASTVTETRKRNGAWVRASQFSGRRISAVLYAPRFDAWTLGHSRWMLIHHPDPNRPFPRAIFPFATEFDWDSTGAAVETGPVSPWTELVGLPADWPGGD